MAKRNETIFPVHATFEGQRKALIEKLKIEEAIDAGANIGQWANATRKLGFKGKIYSYEPDPRAFSILTTDALVKKANWEIFNIALGEKNETSVFNDWGIEGKQLFTYFDEAR